ncbi:MAG: hypothetical protein OEV80_03805, partial [candidate division Zixibacteria bacterium]|nr:hypothetical protein [candidate division Zixibacteria bacterium]
MKTRALLLAALMTLLSGGMAWGQSLSLDHVDGLNAGGGLEMGVPVTFYIRVTSDNDSHGGATNGFVVSSSTGAQWGGTVGDTTGTLGKAQFDGGFFISYFSADGMGEDTVGFGGFKFFSTGLPAGFDDVAYTIQIGPIDAAYNGGEICLDSAYYPPSGVWKWAGPDVFPGWDGPHCYTVGEAASNPEITCPGDTSVFLCDPGTVCFPFEVANADWVTASEPAYIENGQVCLDLGIEDSQATMEITLVAGSGEAVDSCTFSVTPHVNFHPLVGMSGAQYSVVVCDLGAPLCTVFHVESSEAEVIDTIFSIPGYVDGINYCFVPDTAGLFDLTIIAIDACGDADTNNSLIMVIEGEPAVVECPESVIDTICGTQVYCFPVEISPDTANVTVLPIGSWVPELGQVCVPIEGSGPLDIAIIAQTECGVDSCHVLLDMTIIEPPAIDCPGGDLAVFIEDAGLVCVDLPISNATGIGVVGGGFWEEGQLCFHADTTGRYRFTVTASNSCGGDTCDVAVQLQVGVADYTTIARPDPMRMVDAYRVDPISALFYLGNFTDGHSAFDVDPASVVINGTLIPTGTEVIPTFPGFVGEVLQITEPIGDFIENNMPLYDTTLTPYTVSGQFTDGGDFTETGLVRLIGLLVGDVNLDGQIDIAD